MPYFFNSQNSAENRDVPYYDFESIMARMERTVERLWILCILLIVLLVGTNLAWIYYENQFEDTVTIEQEATSEDGGNAIVNNTGSVNYGTSEADNN